MSIEEVQAYREQMGQAFAEALGISVEELESAIAEGLTPCEIVEAQEMDAAEVWEATASARQELFQQAVADGLLTQRQAYWISERMADHNPGEWCNGDGPPGFVGKMRALRPFGGERGHRPFGPMGTGFEEAQGYRVQLQEVFAEALGMNVDELEAAITEGQTLSQIAEAQGADLQTVYDAMAAVRQESMRQAIEQAVEDGQMSREQADWMLRGLEQGWMGGRGFRPGGFDPEGQGWPQGSGHRGRFVMPGQ